MIHCHKVCVVAGAGRGGIGGEGGSFNQRNKKRNKESRPSEKLKSCYSKQLLWLVLSLNGSGF